MPREFTEQEGVLVNRLGVYGIWLLKHGKNLPDNKALDDLMLVYELWRSLATSCGDKRDLELIHAIDEYCKTTGWEEPLQNYELALKDFRS